MFYIARLIQQDMDSSCPRISSILFRYDSHLNTRYAAEQHNVRELDVNLERTPTGLAPRKPPEGWTWHHQLDEGIMRLVPRTQYTSGSEFWEVLHPDGFGGYALWGK